VIAHVAFQPNRATSSATDDGGDHRNATGDRDADRQRQRYQEDDQRRRTL
jgi:hypothetical protein